MPEIPLQPNPNPPNENLLPLVYTELRQLAAAKMAQERVDHTLDATALVHEAYLKIVDHPGFESKSHFFRVASEAMRRVLIDHARSKRADKRGGEHQKLPLDPDQFLACDMDSGILIIDEALSRFACVDAQAAELVQLRYFGGLSNSDACAILEISPRTGDRLWAYAKAWLYRELSEKFLA
jgi:RNA polymerase sigma factor (TIGR02999 family)